MEDAVNKIIAGIEPELVFDSHFVIAQVLKRDSEAYIHFASAGETTAQMHGRIAQIIQRSSSVRQLPQQSWSETIHGSPRRCALWQRI